ncbi:hypothetical protein C6497_03655 [Candidatus Poribacteria bacterium]|nr:MAG: hypothetical protein C6497_03655 [Candidatus Poribacteria bacterium]
MMKNRISTKNKNKDKSCGNSLSSYLGFYIALAVIATLFTNTTVDAADITDFIPIDSILYLQLNDINDLYTEIQISDSWDHAINNLFPEDELEELQKGILFIQTILMTDPATIIDTIGSRSGITFWNLSPEDLQGGLVIHSGGNLTELQKITKILTGMMGTDADITFTLNAGEHEKVKYSSLQFQEIFVTFGFVSDFLVVGIGENSIETLIDTYRKKRPSLKKNNAYTKVEKKYGDGQFSIFMYAPEVLPKISGLSDELQEQLQAFNTLFVNLNLLEGHRLIQLHTDFNPNLPENYISELLIKGTELESINKATGDEALFIAISPNIVKTLWNILETEIETNANQDIYDFITYIEGLLNLDLNNDIFPGLTGEYAISVDDFHQFDPSSIESLELELINTFTIDAANVDTNGGLLYIPSNIDKWNQIQNSLSNLQNISVTKTEFNGTKVSRFASNIHFAKKDSVSILSFSENQTFSILDRIQNRKKLTYFKGIPKNPLIVLHFDLLSFLQAHANPHRLQNDGNEHEETSRILAWIVVKDNEAVFKSILSDKDSPLEVMSKLIPLIQPF